MDELQKEQVRQQIMQMTSIQMTGSIQTLSEEKIHAVTDQVIKDQIEREKVYDKRESFLAGNGYEVRAELSDQIKQAAAGEPLEKKPERKAKKAQKQQTLEMNRQIRVRYEAMREEMREDEMEQRKMLEAKEFSFVHSESFATFYQYETLGNARKWMLDNPEAYAQNKEAVDAIYKDMYIADEVYGAMSREARYYEFMDKKGRAMATEVDRRVVMLSKRMTFVEHRLGVLSDALQMLLRGKQVSDTVKETLQEYTDKKKGRRRQRKPRSHDASNG